MTELDALEFCRTAPLLIFPIEDGKRWQVMDAPFRPEPNVDGKGETLAQAVTNYLVIRRVADARGGKP